MKKIYLIALSLAIFSFASGLPSIVNSKALVTDFFKK
jgi:hypothetical protein